MTVQLKSRYNHLEHAACMIRQLLFSSPSISLMDESEWAEPDFFFFGLNLPVARGFFPLQGAHSWPSST